MSALSAKAADGGIVVLEDFSFDAPKTSTFKNIVSSLELGGKKALFVTGDLESDVVRSGRNIPGVTVKRAQDLNTYSVMNSDTLVLCEGAVEKLKSIHS